MRKIKIKFWVECSGCKSRSGSMEDKNESVMVWNRRIGDGSVKV